MVHWNDSSRSLELGGLDLYSYFNGTLNIDIRPFEFQLRKPEFTFHHVEWTDLLPGAFLLTPQEIQVIKTAQESEEHPHRVITVPADPRSTIQPAIF